MPASTLLGLINDDSEDELRDSGMEDVMPARRTAARPAARKTTTTTTARGKKGKAATTKADAKRKPLAEMGQSKASAKPAVDEDATMQDPLDDSIAAEPEEIEEERIPKASRAKKFEKSTARRGAASEAVITEAENAMEVAPPSASRTTMTTNYRSRTTVNGRTRSPSVQRRTVQRSGSFSDAERGAGDATLRRKLGDMTRKFEALEVKYRSLQEVGARSAEANFEELKKASTERARQSDELIKALKDDLAEMQRQSSAKSTEVQPLKAQVSEVEAQNEALKRENRELADKLAEAQAETRRVKTRLETSKAQLEAAEQKLSNAVSRNAGSRAPIISGVDATQEAQLKEDLYSDLTGLIVRGVKKEDGEDVFDCIQTGRNGTLHFHLRVAQPGSTSEPATPSNGYDDAEFTYIPLLDENRDRDLLDVLEVYLTEEIFFPRKQAAKFYSRVVDCITKKVATDS